MKNSIKKYCDINLVVCIILLFSKISYMLIVGKKEKANNTVNMYAVLNLNRQTGTLPL